MIEPEIIEFEFFGFIFKENKSYHGGVASRRGLCASAFAHKTMANAKKALKETMKERVGKIQWVKDLKCIKTEDARYILERFLKELNLYFMGELKRFTLPIEIGGGSDFDRKVWSKLEQIPYGETVSYGFIAEKIGEPKAKKAVGNACVNNPLPIIIPSHRAVESGKKIGQSTAGIMKKKMLLKIECAASQPKM